MHNPPPSRRWWHHVPVRLSVRALMIFVLVSCCGLGWLAHRARAQRDAIAVIRGAGGQFYYDYQYAGATFPKSPKSWVPGWLRDAIGDDFFHHVAWVRVEGEGFGGRELAALGALDRVEALGVVETDVDDAGLVCLKGRTRLKSLWLGGNRITDAGLTALGLGDMPSLELLEVRSTGVSKSWLQKIRQEMPRLMILDDGPSHRFVKPRSPREIERIRSIRRWSATSG